MERDEIITLPSGTEITVEFALADIQRAAAFLVRMPDEDAQGLAADLNTATDLLAHLADKVDKSLGEQIQAKPDWLYGS